MATPIEDAPQWERDLLREHRAKLAASHAEAEAALEAIRRGDWSQIVTYEQFEAWLEAQDEAEAEAS